MRTRRWREWTPEQEQRSRARAAYMFLNMTRCSDCGLPWPEGFVHAGCPGPAPETIDVRNHFPYKKENTSAT